MLATIHRFFNYRDAKIRRITILSEVALTVRYYGTSVWAFLKSPASRVCSIFAG